MFFENHKLMKEMAKSLEETERVLDKKNAMINRYMLKTERYAKRIIDLEETNSKLEREAELLKLANDKLTRDLAYTDNLLNNAVDALEKVAEAAMVNDDEPDYNIGNEVGTACNLTTCSHNKDGRCKLECCVYSDEYDNDPEYEPRDDSYHVELVDYYPSGAVKHIVWRKNEY